MEIENYGQGAPGLSKFTSKMAVKTVRTLSYLYCCHQSRAIASSLSSHEEYRMVPGGRQSLDQANWLELQACLNRQPVNHIHHHHLLSLLSPKADTGTHFNIPWRVDG